MLTLTRVHMRPLWLAKVSAIGHQESVTRKLERDFSISHKKQEIQQALLFLARCDLCITHSFFLSLKINILNSRRKKLGILHFLLLSWNDLIFGATIRHPDWLKKNDSLTHSRYLDY